MTLLVLINLSPLLQTAGRDLYGIAVYKDFIPMG